MPVTEGETNELFERGRAELAAGRITKAHRLFAQLAETEPDHPFLGHAMAVSLPDSFLLKIDRQLEKHNAPLCRQALFELHYQYLDVRLMLIDMSEVRYLTSPGIEVLSDVLKWPEVTVKLIDVHPRPAQILKMLGLQRIIWDDFSCPVCGREKRCLAKFAQRNRHPLGLPR